MAALPAALEATQDKALKLACFCTGPAIRSAPANFVSEVIATFVLILVITALVSKAVAAPTLFPAGLTPCLVDVRAVGF